MSLESDLIQCPSTECTDVLRPDLFFAPPPQHTDAPPPELFDQEVARLDLDLPFEPFEDFFTTFNDTIPVIYTPSTSTYSTDSVREVTSSQYSSDFTLSDYPIASEIESYFSMNSGLYGTPDSDSIHSADFPNGPPFIHPVHPAEPEVQFDFGTSDLSPDFVGISPEDLSTTVQPPLASIVPAPLPVHVMPDSEAPIAPAFDSDRPYKCPLCSHSSKRKYNMKKHIGTHYKLKPFECTTCGSLFSRQNDLDRHCRNPNVHRKMKSVSSISGRCFDPNPGLVHGITINGDPRLTTSAYPDPIM